MAKRIKAWFKEFTKSADEVYLENAFDHADLERRQKVLSRHSNYYI